jgi:hypothetical protein
MLQMSMHAALFSILLMLHPNHSAVRHYPNREEYYWIANYFYLKATLDRNRLNNSRIPRHPKKIYGLEPLLGCCNCGIVFHFARGEVPIPSEVLQDFRAPTAQR